MHKADVAPPAENDPGIQSPLGDASPESAQYFPAEQGLHDDAACVEKDPGVQMPEGEASPVELQKYPEGHETQRRILEKLLYKKPMAQSTSKLSDDVV